MLPTWSVTRSRLPFSTFMSGKSDLQNGASVTGPNSRNPDLTAHGRLGPQSKEHAIAFKRNSAFLVRRARLPLSDTQSHSAGHDRGLGYCVGRGHPLFRLAYYRRTVDKIRLPLDAEPCKQRTLMFTMYGLIAGCFLSMVKGIQNNPNSTMRPWRALKYGLIADVFAIGFLFFVLANSPRGPGPNEPNSHNFDSKTNTYIINGKHCNKSMTYCY
jgi:hypothetical protein